MTVFHNEKYNALRCGYPEMPSALLLIRLDTQTHQVQKKARSVVLQNGPLIFSSTISTRPPDPLNPRALSFYSQAAASAPVSPAPPSGTSSSVYPSTRSSNCLYLGRPVPAGIKRPMMTFSFNPFKLSTFPATAA